MALLTAVLNSDDILAAINQAKGAAGSSAEIMGGGGVVIMQGNSWYPAGW
jgi:hypothetical protein